MGKDYHLKGKHMILFRYTLFLVFALLTFTQASPLLTLQENSHYTLNTATIKQLNYLTEITLPIEHQEITYHARSYRRSPNGSIYWEGESKSYASHFSFTLMHGALLGDVEYNQEHYILTLLPHSSTEYTIVKRDPTKAHNVCQKKCSKAPSSTQKQKSTQKPAKTSSSTPPMAALETTTQIDVLILYTQAFQDYYGANTDLTIQHYFDIANTIYNDSQTYVHLNLVHTQPIDATTLSEYNNITTTLSNLQSNTDVHALKQKYHADLVSLFRKYDGTSGTCGLGYLFNNTESTNYFYTVIEIKPASEGASSYCPDRTFAHEVGHNFGCAHDRDHANVYPDNDYAYGYDIVGEFATIMSYDTPQIPYFSNPNLQYNGIDIGEVDVADCARNIREKRLYVKQSSDAEAGDVANDTNLSGILNDKRDKDAFSYKLKGDISFTLSHENSYYVQVYDSQGYLIIDTDSSFTHTFAEDTYTIVSSFTNADGTLSYPGTNSPYAIDFSTSDGSITFIPPVNESKAFIERFYQNILGRPSDTGGLNYWMNILQTHSATKVALGFFHSSEFFNLHLNDNDFVDILYHTLFDREPDTSGKNHWLDLLAQGSSRDSVLYGFFNSQEFYNLAARFHVTAIRPIDQISGLYGYINRFYALVLGREADQAGFDYWVSALVNKTKRGGDIAKGFFKSNEYINRHLNNTTFIDICYKAFFDRAPDSEGKSLWLSRLNQGASVDDILDGFIGSQEFINLSASFGIIP